MGSCDGYLERDLQPSSTHPQAPGTPESTEEVVFTARSGGCRHLVPPRVRGILDDDRTVIDLFEPLVRYGSVTTRKLRDASGMDKGQMSRALRELEQRGLLERDADATHELRQVLRISDAGTTLYNRIMPDARKSQAALLAHLTLGERKALDSALRKLKAVAEAEPAEGTERRAQTTGSKKK